MDSQGEAEPVRIARPHDGAAAPLQAMERPVVTRHPHRVVVVGEPVRSQRGKGPRQFLASGVAPYGDAYDDAVDLDVEQFLPDREGDLAASGTRRVDEQ